MPTSTDVEIASDPYDRLLHAYESAIAASAGIRHAVAFSYGRTALWSALQALGLKPGHEVVLSPLTCQVVPLVLLALKLRPVYADIDPETLNLDAGAARRAITPATRAILFQHTYGISAGLREADAMARNAGLRLIEDCAQCLPVASGEELPGARDRIVIYSNNLRKPMPAGSGGVVATNDEELAQEMSRLRDALPGENLVSQLRLRTEVLLHRHVLRPSRYWLLYELSRRYLNGRRTTSAAAAIATQVDAIARRPSSFRLRLGLRWAARIDAIAQHSRHCVEDYAKLLTGSSGLLIPAAAQERVLYYYPVRSRRKAEWLRQAKQSRIELIAWPVRTPIFPMEDAAETARLGYAPGMCPHADRMAGELVGLPTEEQITQHDRQAIVALIRNAMAS
jgi:perosamine synthetase